MMKPLKLRGSEDYRNFLVEVDWLVYNKYPNLKDFYLSSKTFYEEKYFKYDENKIVCYHIQKKGLFFNGLKYIDYREFLEDYEKALLKMYILHPIIDKGFYKEHHKKKIKALIKKGVKVKVPFIKNPLDFDKNIKLRKKLILYYLLKQPWIVPYFIYKVLFVNRLFRKRTNFRIAFVGMDGSGKTTTIKNLKKNLTDKGFNVSVMNLGIYHKRSKFMNILSKLYWKFKRKKIIKREIEAGGSVKAPTTLKNILRFLDMYLRYRKSKKRQGIVLYDRYFYDFIFYKEPNMLTKLLVKIAPKPDLIFYLKADVNDLYKRKREYSVDFIKDAIKRMNKYINKLNLIEINTSKSKKIVRREVINKIFSSQKFLKKLQFIL